jgi:predicted N-acyltransferase
VGLTYELHNSIDSVNRGDWERVCATGGNAFMDPRFIRAVESSLRHHSRFWHLVVYDERHQPVACACASTVRVDVRMHLPHALRWPVSVACHWLPGRLSCKVLFVGLPVSLGQRQLVVVPGTDPRTVIELLDDVISRIAVAERARLVFYKEFGEQHRAWLEPLVERGYRCAEISPMHHFPVRFASFDDYLENLRAPYRQSITRQRRKFTSSGLHLVRLTELEDIREAYTPAVHRLYEAVVNQATQKLVYLPREFFLELAHELPGAVSLTLACNGDEVVGCIWSLRADATYHLLFCGLNHAVNHEAAVYFNLIYAELDQGLREQVEDIEVGQAADRFKAGRLGCAQSSRFIYMRGAGPLWNRLLRAAFDRIVEPRAPIGPYRRVFRTEDADRDAGSPDNATEARRQDCGGAVHPSTGTEALGADVDCRVSRL